MVGLVSNSTSLADIAVEQLRGVGPRSLEKLSALGVYSVLDVLLCLPIRYEDRSKLSSIINLKVEESTSVEGRIVSTKIVFTRRRQLLCQMQDDTGVLNLRFFHFTIQQQQLLTQIGARIRVYGLVRQGSMGKEMVHPSYQITQTKFEPMQVAEYYTPVYRAVKGLQLGFWLKITEQACALLQANPGSVMDSIPAQLRDKFRLPTIGEALLFVHRPPIRVSVSILQSRLHPMFKRLALEEMLAHQLALSTPKSLQISGKAPVMINKRNEKNSLVANLIANLPFELTAAQWRVSAEIALDCARDKPMVRLLQGDVGSGKTLVAALAVCQALDSRYQVAIMAPTEILATQHLRCFKRWLEPLGIKIDLLVGSLPEKPRRDVLARLKNGITGVVIGTHALFQTVVQFKNLGFLVIDEQHRFGVSQRLALRDKSEKGVEPHQLVMTATPIPRSLAMVAYSHCDHSVIDALPPGRKPIQTVLVSQAKRDQVIQRLGDKIQAGARVYWVCPLIEESDSLALQTVEASYDRLKECLPDCVIDLLHGKMSAARKEAAMARFASGESQILVATTVIEVGVDVPEATVIVIENAERFGLAQLHQLRGRVGRGSEVSHCILIYNDRLSAAGRMRLQVMRECSDGFDIAEADLRQRGPGELLGERQAGFFQFQIADWERDSDLLVIIQQIKNALNECASSVWRFMIKKWIKSDQKWLQS
jgi:ATP-dependent DNA helicase RecG